MRDPSSVEGDPVALIFLLAVGVGLASVWTTELVGLVLPLAALAVAYRLLRLRSVAPVARSGEVAALSFVLLGAVLYLLPPAGFATFRGLLLALTLLPIGWSSVRRATPWGVEA